MYRYAILALLPITALAAQIGDIQNVEKRQISISIGFPTESSTGGSSSTQSPSSGSDSSTNSSTTSSSPTPSSSTSSSPSVTSTTTTITSTATTRTTESSSSSIRESFSPSITSSQSPVVETYTTFVDGSMTVGTRTTNTAVPVTTSVRASGSGLAAPDNGNDSGLSSDSKKIIGGVVGGIGGALLVGALAFTAWRIWGKKKNLQDDDFFDPNANEPKLSSSTTDNTPFRSTLDQYHQPGPVNTASNF